MSIGLNVYIIADSKFLITYIPTIQKYLMDLFHNIVVFILQSKNNRDHLYNQNSLT